MSEFLTAMSRASRDRVDAAARRTSLAELERRVSRAPAARALRLSAAGFDLIAEIKLRTPRDATGLDTPVRVGALIRRARAYAAGGAAAISVLTEPTRFGGSLEHLRAIAAAVRIPVMRKDFLVDPYQVVEACEAGASGVLVIARLLDDCTLASVVNAALDLSLFVLLEAFDREDLARIEPLLGAAEVQPHQLLVGVNCRDLHRLTVDRARLTKLVQHIPPEATRVAESGLRGAGDAGSVAVAGYEMALVGTSLMRAADPAAAVATFLAAGRAARRNLCVSG